MSDNRIVLVSCCAPCSAGAIQELEERRSQSAGELDFIVLFFNPNIYPETEYQKRLAEQIKYCDALGVKYHTGYQNTNHQHEHEKWLNEIRGLENEPERGARCSKCFRYRFKYAAQFARENGYNAIASVLGVSRHKDQSQVDAAAIDILSGNQSPPHADTATATKIPGTEQFPPPLAGGDRNSGRGVAYHHGPRFTTSALSNSKHLKQNMTDAERLLWHYLRGRKDYSFRKQQAIGNYIVDFVCVSKKLIIELDGAQHGDKRHVQHDSMRDIFLQNLGYRVLRFWNTDVFKNMDMVLDTIYRNLIDSNSHPPMPLASPPAKGGGNCGTDDMEIKYLPIKWDENLRGEINKKTGFYRQNYCGCEFSIRKV